jgi:hypothetical protein
MKTCEVMRKKAKVDEKSREKQFLGCFPGKYEKMSKKPKNVKKGFSNEKRAKVDEKPRKNRVSGFVTARYGKMSKKLEKGSKNEKNGENRWKSRKQTILMIF